MNLFQSFYNQTLVKFYTGLKIYVDYISGLPTNDGLTPQTPVDTITTALGIAGNFSSLPKLIFVMRGIPSKKGDILNEVISINIPFTAIDFNFIKLKISTDGAIAVTLASYFTGIFNADIDGFDQPTTGTGVEFNGNNSFVINSFISNFKGFGIIVGSTQLPYMVGSLVSSNEVGLHIGESQGFNCMGNVFLLNNKAIQCVSGDGFAFVTRNIFVMNNIDVEDNEYYYTATDGVGSLNKLTSPGASWTPGEYTGFTLIDANNKVYKIVNNTTTELNIIGVNVNGEAIDVTPANGNFWILHSFNDVYFIENYWDKLQNASLHVNGDANEDGIMDRVIQMPEQGIGIGKSSLIDIRPLTLTSLISMNNLDVNNVFQNYLYLVNSRKFIKATTDIPNRNVLAGMLDKIVRKIANREIVEELTYDTQRDVAETKIK